MTNKLPCIISITILVFIVHVKTTIPAEISREIIVIARHGSLENTPENTFAAFEKAADIGVMGLEIDVRRTKDDKLILMHDDTIDRTTDGKGYVNKLLYDEIKLYDAGSWKGEKFAGERVPLLSEALQFAKERKIKIILNVKEHGIEHKTLSLIEEFAMINHVYFSGRLEFLRNKNIDIKGAELVFLPPDEETNDAISLIHEKRNHVGTKLFGTDDRDKMKEKMFKGVDIILTDYPSVAIDLLHFRTINIPEKREPRKKLETNIVGNPEQITALIDTITQGSPDQSRMAALVFSTLPAGLAVPPLVEHLDYKKPLKRFFPKIKINLPFRNNDIKEKESLLPVTLVQQNIVWALGLIKDKSAVWPLMKRLETADSDLKREIILALKMIGDKQAVPALNEILLEDENPFIRYDAARALGQIASTDSIFTLIKALKNDNNWMVKGACAVALAGTDDKRAINELEKLLNVDEGYEASWARDRAAWALSRMGDEGLVALVSSLGKTGGRRACWTLVEIGEPAIPYMLTTLRGAGRNSRRRAAIALGWIGSREAVAPLSWALIDEDYEVRKAAAWALGRIGGDKAVLALERALVEQNERDKEINNRISILNYQLSALNDRFVIPNKKEMQITALKLAFKETVLKDRFAESNIDMVQSDITELPAIVAHKEDQKNKIIASIIDMVQRDITGLIVMMSHKEDQKNKIIASIKESKKGIQENKEVTEYTKEAIQRINYNLKQRKGKEL